MTIIRAGRRTIEVTPTLIDKAVGYFNPEAGERRFRSRVRFAAMGGYDGGRKDRRATKKWRPGEGSADADALPDLPDLRGRSRDLVRNMPIATGALATKVNGVVGDGLRLQAAIDAKALGITEDQASALEAEQEREWGIFCKSADFTSVQHFDEMSALACRSEAESGDAILLRRYRRDPGCVYGTKLQLIEADRLCNKDRAADGDMLAGGVETDSHGVPRFYHIANRHPGTLRNSTALSWEKVPARDRDGRQLVIHLYDRLRPELSRGVPWFAPCIELFKQLGDYTDAEVTAAVVSAMYTVFIESAADDSGSIAGGFDSSLADNEVALSSGAVVGLAPGEKAVFPQAMRPNAQFDPFVLSILRQVGVALGLPFELLVKHFTASYSASRAALEMAWQFFRAERSRISRRLHAVAYEWAMEEAVAIGRLDRPGFFDDPGIRQAYLGANWIGPPRASLNPYQEAQADALDMESGVKTADQVCHERTGGMIEKKIPQRGREITLARENGLSAVEQSPKPAAASEPPAPSGSDDDDETKPGGRA